MEPDIFTKLLTLFGSIGGEIIFKPMCSKSKGLFTIAAEEYTAEEMENLMHLAEDNNIRVCFEPFVSNDGKVKYKREIARIGIRSGMDFNEYVHSIAREIAHCFLHFDKGDTITSDNYKEYEEQADRGAKMLLAALSISEKGGAS